MNYPEIRVDFNEMVEPDLVLLSKSDEIIDSTGATVRLQVGMRIKVFCDDTDASGRPDRLVANGVAVRNETGVSWTLAAKWCCRIDSDGIKAESEI